MKNICLKKSFICGIIVLLIGSGVVSAFYGNPSISSKPMNSGNWLYVGGNGPGNYSTIQSAIDVTNAGDTVFVYSGIYYEHVILDGSYNDRNYVTLLGENKYTTIIDGCGYSVALYFVNCHNEHISGFSVINGSVWGCRFGADGFDCYENTLSDCLIYNNLGFGLSFYGHYASAVNNYVINCEIYQNNGYGIGTEISTNGDVSNCHIQDCKIFDNSNGGIEITAHGFFISNCNVYNNNGIGIYLVASNNNNILSNNISNNNLGAVLYTSSFNNVINNTIFSNIVEGLEIQYQSNYNIIQYNKIFNQKDPSEPEGIFIQDDSCYNTISNNEISDNSLGIFVYYADYNLFIENNLIGNDISIRITTSNNNMVYHNNCINSGPFNALDYNGLNMWDNGYPSGGNYWGDYTGVDNYHGPNQDISGSDGIGDTPYISYTGKLDNYPFLNPNGWNILPTPDIVYVDDDYTSSTPGWGYDHFSSIQAGIDAVDVGGTVNVASGTYYEDIVIGKSMNLIGENAQTTILVGAGGDQILRTANYVSHVNVSNFWAKSSTITGFYPTMFVSHITFENCITSGCHYGLLSYASDYIIIKNCSFYDNTEYGIALAGTGYSEVIDCNIYSNTVGLYALLYYAYTSHDNILYHNNFYDNNQNIDDSGDNTWYNSILNQGNYYDDYTGIDANGNGIGDTPYNIPGGSNQDLYPFMNPNGWLNNPPFTPHDPMPIDYATNISLNTLLQWIGGDPDTDDNVTYDVYLGSTLPLPKVSSNQSKPWYKSQTSSYNTNYYWKIVAWDNHGLSAKGPIWRFTTCSGPINHPPNIPSNPSPPNQATSVDIDAALSWTGGDPDAGDFVFYDVYFGSMPPLEKIASNITAKSYNPGPLAYSLTYFWKVVAWDIRGLSTVGPVWYFTTMNATNNPPNKPSKPSGVTNGKIGQEYSYTTITTDPDGDQVYYLWDWGDGNNSGWLGPYNSGITTGVTHNWTIKGSYSIKVKAKDIHGNESNWSDPLPITMPFSYHMTLLQLLQRFFQRFPHTFPILRQLLRY